MFSIAFLSVVVHSQAIVDQQIIEFEKTKLNILASLEASSTRLLQSAKLCEP